MVFYMHIVLFFICLNFGLGIAHIPDTPLSIPDSGLAATADCRKDFTMQGLLERQVDSNGVVTYIPVSFNQDGTPINDYSGIAGNFTGGLDPLADAANSLYQAGETMKNVVLGGYVTNVLESITLSCDTEQYLDPPINSVANPNFGTAVDSEVMTYMKAGIHIIFGLMIFLTIFYIITGKTFGF
tara:strand:- start:64 stop:615 length:552 start_codon:yes stop_codon:yes gene_type:complete